MKDKKKGKVTRIGYWLANHWWAYFILSYTWGLVWSVVGILWSIIMLITFHKPHIFRTSWYFVSWFKGGWGFELGNCFVISKDCVDDIKNGDLYILCHEAGHNYQNAIFGPFFIFLVIAGIVRYWYREIKYYHKGLEPKTDYDDIWFEGSATAIGRELLYTSVVPVKF